ncbi:MAG: hypothetical protein IKF68_04095 [Erysipelotrichaceae bacterium]|nr:hypothetical protein [Erysipelotrichaceae bacterium]
MKVTVKGPGLTPRTYEYPSGVKVEQVLKEVRRELPFPVYACKLDNAYRALTHIVRHDSTVEFLDMRNQATWLVYQNSLILLFIKVLHDVMGKDTHISVRNSINKGLYINVTKEMDEETIRTVEDGMRELVEKDEPIIKEWDSQSNAKRVAKELGQKETFRIINTMPVAQDLSIYSLDDEKQIFYSLMVPSTSYLQYFELRKYKRGLLIRFPHQKDPVNLLPYRDEEILYDAFRQTYNWGKITGIKYICDLNERAGEDHEDLFLLQEALHNKRINEISDAIIERGSRIVLICGPSSSGKTTFAKRMCIQLSVNGKKTLYMGTDDYFLNRDETAVDENGEKDFESINAVDTKLFISDLKRLLKGETVDIPVFNFISGEKEFGKRVTKIDSNTIIVIEGIHALNRKLTEGIDESTKYKIYISPFSPISLDRINRFPTTDARMLRRLVRDHQFRGKPARETLRDWHKVRAGEDTNIFPLAGEADSFFNSNLIYEMAVLKKYAEPLLKDIKREEAEYAEAQRLLGYLNFAAPINDDDLIVNNSIIREFIGGSAIVK